MVAISVTHMSHIETGNTKLSLQVLVDLANSLGVQTDDLLRERHEGRGAAMDEIISVLDECDTDELRVIQDLIKTAKISMKKYLKK